VGIGRIHLNEGLSAPEGLVGGHSTNDHLGDSVENPTLPIVVVISHLFAVLSVLLESTLFNASQVSITNVLVVLHQLGNDLLAVGVEVLRELGNPHDFLVREVNRLHEHGVLNVLYLLLNVLGVLQDTALRFLEGLNAVLALADELRDSKRLPVVVVLALVHQLIQSIDVLFQQATLNRA
jgi:hypothetical protein